MRRGKIDNLKSRLTLSLVKAGTLHGVEVWGWRRREEIERLQSEFVKMLVGIARNTPNYIWKLTEYGSRNKKKSNSNYIFNI